MDVRPVGIHDVDAGRDRGGVERDLRPIRRPRCVLAGRVEVIGEVRPSRSVRVDREDVVVDEARFVDDIGERDPRPVPRRLEARGQYRRHAGPVRIRDVDARRPAADGVRDLGAVG